MQGDPNNEWHGFGVGEDVRIITTGKVGRINNSDVTGTYYEIWLYGGGILYGVPEWQVEYVDAPTTAEKKIVPETDNVVPVDFTAKKRANGRTVR